MIFKKKLTIILMVFLSANIYSQENIKIMFYNILQFPEAPPSNRDEILKTIIDETAPDLFMVCELQSDTGAQTILNKSLQTTDDRYKMVDFVDNQSSGADLQQLVFYNSKKLILENQNEVTTSVRDINHYIFKLKSTDVETNPVYIDAFVTHLKSSQGSNNEQLRLDMVLDFTTALAQVPKDHFVLFAGDFNFYTSNEAGYQEILDPTNSIILKDPINRSGNWHTNSSFADIHTQSTRTSNSSFGGFGAGGGLDDRFDFIMISENLLNSSTLSYIDQSYKAFGNNGNCYNVSINNSNCSGTYSQSVRNSLYNMSDHLPVIMELQTDKVLSVENVELLTDLIRLTEGNIIKNKLPLKIDVKLLNEKLVIYNSLGQKIKIINITNSMISNEVIIDATNLTSGIYYLTIANSSIPNLIKFIKAVD